MTREEACKAAEVMLAYANGEEVEGMDFDGKYRPAENPSFSWDKIKYRVKSKPTYRPFRSKEECWNEMHNHADFGWVKLKSKTSDVNRHISNIEKDIEDNVYFITASFSGTERFSAKQMFDYFEFTDGAPFGIKEE